MPLQPTATPFSTLLSRIDVRDGVAVLDVPDDWLQGRTLFGGLQAVIGLAAMRSLVPEPLLRSLQLTFLDPVPGGRVTVRALDMCRSRSVIRSARNDSATSLPKP